MRLKVRDVQDKIENEQEHRHIVCACKNVTLVRFHYYPLCCLLHAVYILLCWFFIVLLSLQYKWASSPFAFNKLKKLANRKSPQIYRVFRKSSPLKLFGIFSLRLSRLRWFPVGILPCRLVRKKCMVWLPEVNYVIIFNIICTKFTFTL